MARAATIAKPRLVAAARATAPSNATVVAQSQPPWPPLQHLDHLQRRAAALRKLCLQHGLDSALVAPAPSHIAPGGLGLFCATGSGTGALTPHTGSGGGSLPPLARVPLRLVLSAALPGAAPQAAHQQPLLTDLLDRLERAWAGRWELQLGALLLWALRDQGALGAFWRGYAAAALPHARGPLAGAGSLLLWDAPQLDALHDADLVDEALAWQRDVDCAHMLHVTPGFAALDPARPPPSAAAWRWAVAAVESRAFEVRGRRSAVSSGATGAPAVVPLLDVANHATTAPTCTHSLAQDGGSIELTWEAAVGGNSSGSKQRAACTELLVSYGEKSSRQLISQYGFSLPNNPHDRVPFRRVAGTAAAHAAAPCVSNSAVAAAGSRLRSRLLGAGGCARASAAVASVIAAAGWRNLAQLRGVSCTSTAAAARELLAEVQIQRKALEQHAQLAQEPDMAVAAMQSGQAGMGASSSAVSAARRAVAAAYVAHRIELLDATAELLADLMTECDAGLTLRQA